MAGGSGRDPARTWADHRSEGLGTRSTPASDSKTTVEKVQGVELESRRPQVLFARAHEQTAFLRETQTSGVRQGGEFFLRNHIVRRGVFKFFYLYTGVFSE